eukprot:scaffold12410_cov56-Phaeocystis_antarctica.AAC.3
MLTTDGSRTAAGRRLRIMHDEQPSARPRRRRQPHLNELKEISARSTSNRRCEVAGLFQGGSRLVPRTQYSRLSWLYLECVRNTAPPC